MLKSAGFVDIERFDRTAAYRDTTAAWLEQRILRADDVIAVLGRDEYEKKVVEGRETVAAIDEGLLRRYLYVASRSR